MSQTQPHTASAYATTEAPKPPARRCFKTAAPSTEYLASVRRLYAHNWGRLLEAAHAFNPELTADEAHGSVSSLAHYLKDYRDKIDDEAFVRWGFNAIKTDITVKVAYRLYKRAVFAGIWGVLSKARRLGVARGMTKVEIDTFPAVVTLSRSMAEEAATKIALLECVGTFSPRVESRSDNNAFSCAIDIAGTEKLFGSPRTLTQNLLLRIRDLGVSASAAISSNFHAAKGTAAPRPTGRQRACGRARTLLDRRST